jgi:hypothetical protein
MLRAVSAARNIVHVPRALAFLGALAAAGPAAAQNAFGFLFGGSPWEGRSSYAPAPSYVPAPSYGYRTDPYAYRSDPYRYGRARSPNYSALPGYSNPYGDDGEDGLPSEAATPRYGPTPEEVMAAIKAVRPGKGPLGPFVNDPTLRAGDIVVTSKGLMVYRGGGATPHRDGDFVSVSNASGLVANRQTLISLEKASRLTPQKPLGAEGKRSRKPTPEIASNKPGGAR